MRLSVDNPVVQKSAAEVLPSVENVLGEDRTLKTALNQFKKEYITKILNETGWNQTAAAKILDIQRTYVSKLMVELGIKK